MQQLSYACNLIVIICSAAAVIVLGAVGLFLLFVLFHLTQNNETKIATTDITITDTGVAIFYCWKKFKIFIMILQLKSEVEYSNIVLAQ